MKTFKEKPLTKPKKRITVKAMPSPALSSAAPEPPVAADEKNASPERIKELLAEAMKNPGVADVMRVYSAFCHADDAQSAYRYFQTQSYPQAVSTSTEVVPC
jgi:hypothetical protein